MPDYPSQEPQRIYYEAFKEHLCQWEWQWFASLSFRPDTSFTSARSQFRRWRLDIISQERLQLGIFLVTSHKAGHKHIHALMIGKNRHGKSLLDVKLETWENAWNHTAEIKEVTENSGVCDYTALHFLGFKSDWADYDFCGINLLEREKNPFIEGDYNVDLL